MADAYEGIAEPVESDQAQDGQSQSPAAPAEADNSDPYASIAQPADNQASQPASTADPYAPIAAPVNPPAPKNPYAVNQQPQPQPEDQKQPAAPQPTQKPGLVSRFINWAETPLLNAKPIGMIGQFDEQAAEHFRAAHPVAGGVVQGVQDVAQGMSSPEDVALAIGAPQSRLLSAYFAIQAARGTYASAKAARDAYQQGKNAEAARYATQAALSAGMAGAAGLHAARGHAAPTGARPETTAPQAPAPEPFGPETVVKYVQAVKSGTAPDRAAAQLQMSPAHQEIAHVANFIYPELVPDVPEQVVPKEPSPSSAIAEVQGRLNQNVRLALQAQRTNDAAETAAGLKNDPPPQVPLPLGMESGHVSQATVNATGEVIKSLPPEKQPAASLSAVDQFTRWMGNRGRFLGPDGKIETVTGQSPQAREQSARVLAAKLFNDEMDRRAQLAATQQEAQSKEAGGQAKEQEENQKQSDEEKIESRAKAEQGEAPELLPDTPRFNTIRDALAKTAWDAPKEQLVKVARNAAAHNGFMILPETAEKLADEHISKLGQREADAEAGAPAKEGQSPAELKPWIEAVQRGDEPFAHVSESSKFKPSETKGMRKVNVTGAGDASGTYYAAKDIKPKDLVDAARAGKLDEFAERWRQGKNAPQKEAPKDTGISAPQMAQEASTAPEAEVKPAEAEKPSETGPARPEPGSYEYERALYGEARKRALARGVNPDSTEEWGNAIAEEENKVKQAWASNEGEKHEEKPAETTLPAGEPQPAPTVQESTPSEKPAEKPAEEAPTPEKNEQPAPKVAQEKKPEPELGQFKPGQKVLVKQSDGSEVERQIRFKHNNGRYVVKGEKSTIPAEQMRPVEEAEKPQQEIQELKNPESAGATAGEKSRAASPHNTFYSNPLDPELFKRYIGEPVAKMAEPLAEALRGHNAVADVANNVHDVLQNLDRTNRATTLEAKRLVRAIKAAGFSQEDGAQVFRHLEDPAVALTPKQVELRDEWIKPLNQVTRVQYVTTKLIESGKFPLDMILSGKIPQEEIAKIVPEEAQYQHRIPVEKETFVDKLLGDSLKRFRAPGNALSRMFPAAKRSVFKEVRGPEGEREAVAVKNGRVMQFLNDKNSSILDDQIKQTKDSLDAARQEKQPDTEKVESLEKKLEYLNARKAEIATDGHTAIDIGGHAGGYITTGAMAEQAAAPLEAKLKAMETEFHTLHGSKNRAVASAQRIENLYYDIDRTEKQIAAIRASVGPAEAEKEGLTRQQAFEQRIQPLQDQIAKLKEKQADLSQRETNTRWGERTLKSIPRRIEDLNARIDALREESLTQGLEGKYWQDKFGRLWKFDRGTTDFISERTGQQYHADARLAGLINYMETNKAMNAAITLESTKNMLGERGMAKEVDNPKEAPDGWKPTSLQQMRGYYFPAHVADAFDQFDYLQSRGAPNVLQKANNFVIQSILMNPIYHGWNIAGNWLTGHAAEALAGKVISPKWYEDNVKAGAEALNVMRKIGGDEYQRLLRLGLDLRGADTGFDETTKDILRSFSDKLAEEPEANKIMSTLVGVHDAAKFMQEKNHQITFGMGDLATLQSFYAKRAELIRDGVPNAEEAARDWTHRLLGEYTTPIRLFGSAGLGRLAENPMAQSFFRYHFGYILRPLAESIREAILPSSIEFKPDESASEQAGQSVNKFGQSPAQQRAIAIARLAFLAAVATFVYPKVLNPLAQKVTGDERAEFPSGGLPKFANDLFESSTGERSVPQLASSVFTPGLGAMKAGELFTNWDTFTGRHIMGSDQDAAGKAKQAGEWLVKGTLPGQMAGRFDQGGLQQTVEALAGFKFPLQHGIREAAELRRDEGSKNPPTTESSRLFASIIAAAAQAHRSGGQNTQLADALLGSGKLTPKQEKELIEAIEDAPIVFAVRGLKGPKDIYLVWQHSTHEERQALVENPGTNARLVRYAESLPDAEAQKVYDELSQP